MCQSKADGGKRCASWRARHEVTPGTGTATRPGTGMTTWVCAKCQTAGVRGGRPGHRCPAPNLVPLTPATRIVLAAIESAGGHPIVVGGSVRDALIADGGPFTPKDIDIEVYGANTTSLARALRRVGRVDDVGESFAVLKVVVDGEDFDVALPREDSKVAAGHRGFDVKVDHTLDEVAAFGRRDFTINAMGWDPTTGELVDPYGGTADLKAGILRHTTAAFREDPLRVLRGVQFAGRFGFTLAPETVTECRSLTGSFKELPTERVWGEWSKIATKAPWPSIALDALQDTGWEVHFPELAAIRGVRQSKSWHPEGTVDVHTGMAADKAAEIAVRDGLSEQDRLVVVLGALTHDFGKATHSWPIAGTNEVTSNGHAKAGGPMAEAFLTRIGAPVRVREHVATIVVEHMSHATTAGVTNQAVRRLMRRLDGNGTGPSLAQWARVVEADAGGRGAASKPSPATAWLEVADKLEARPSPSILRGEHLMAAGLRPGPAFSPIMAAAISAQDDGLFDDEAGAVSWLGTFLNQSDPQRRASAGMAGPEIEVPPAAAPRAPVRETVTSRTLTR